MINERQAKEKSQEKVVVKKALEGVIATNNGKPTANIYKRVANEDGVLVVQKVDETNLDEFIQASKSMTDLAALQKQFIELGEIPAVNPNLQGDIDTTIYPHNIHELYSMVNDVQGNFDKLPGNIKDIFGDSRSYLSSILDGSVNDKIIQGLQPKEKKDEQKAPEGN